MAMYARSMELSLGWMPLRVQGKQSLGRRNNPNGIVAILLSGLFRSEAIKMRFYTTMWGKRGLFSDDVINVRSGRGDRFKMFSSALKIKKGDVVLVNGAPGASDYWADLFFASIIALKGAKVLISDATWHPRALSHLSKAGFFFRLSSWLSRKLLLLCDYGATEYCFLSQLEVSEFARESGIPVARVHFTRFCTQFPDNFEFNDSTIEDRLDQSGYLFAGGNSLRDYDTLAAALKNTPFSAVIGTSNVVPEMERATVGYIPGDRFFDVMKESALVVVPLLGGLTRSVGQQTYLNAMAMGKLVIVSDTPGVRDHLCHESNALIVPPGDPTALKNAICWAFDPNNRTKVKSIRKNARKLGIERSFFAYCRELEGIMRVMATRATPDWGK